MAEPSKMTEEDMSILGDLCKKGTADTMRSLNTTMDLAMETGGIGGLWVIAMRQACNFIWGSAMTLGVIQKTIKGEELPEKNAKEGWASDDDVLFCALLAAATQMKKQDGGDAMKQARLHFAKVRGYDYNFPWKEAGWA